MVFRHASVIIVLGLFASSAYAHVDGQSFEQQVGDILIDAGFDLPLTVGQSSLFDLQLFHMKDDDLASVADFDSVQLQLFSGSLIQSEETAQRAEFGKTALQLTPKVSGHWKLHIQFTGKEIVSATFDVTIRPYTRKISAWTIVIPVIILGILIDMLFINRFTFIPGAKH